MGRALPGVIAPLMCSTAPPCSRVRVSLHQNDSSFKGAQFNMAVGISTLVDQGRMFFPNIDRGRC